LNRRKQQITYYYNSGNLSDSVFKNYYYSNTLDSIITVYSTNQKKIEYSPSFDFTINTLASENAFRLKVYPNPSDQCIYLKSNKISESVIIHDLTGKIILSENNFNSSRIDVSHLTDGIYFLQLIFSDGSIVTEKVVIQ
jgi:hypothetical protein